LDHQGIETGVDVVQHRRSGAGEIIGVGGADNVWICARVRVASRVGEARVLLGDCAIIRVKPDVSVCIARHAKEISGGIEIEAKAGP
jgi:hypothetical protein